MRWFQPVKSRSFSLAIASIALAMFAGGSCLAQEAISPAFTSFDAPGAGTGSAQGTFPVAITREGFIGLTVFDNNTVAHAYVRTPKGYYSAVAPPNSIDTYLAGLNSSGQIVGAFIDSKYQTHGYFRNSDGTFIQLDVPGATVFTNVAGINAVGQIAGTYFAAGGSQQSYFWDVKNPSQYVTYTVSGSTATVATGINTSGEITGLYFDSAGAHAFIRTPDGTISTFDFGGGNTVNGPLLINTRGQITGGAFNQGFNGGFLRTPNGQFTFWAVTLHVGPQPQGINDSGVIVGYFYSDAGSNSAFVRDAAGNITNITVPFSNTATQATGINGAGHIIGNYTDANGASHGWVD